LNQRTSRTNTKYRLVFARAFFTMQAILQFAGILADSDIN